MLEFLRDYPNVFPVAVAVLNGALAAISANYPFKSACRKLTFIAVVLSLSLSAVGAAVYSQYLINIQNTQGREWWGNVREQLGTFITEGETLMQQCRQENVPPPEPTASMWGAHIENYLRSTLGESYVDRLRSDAGLPLVNPSIQSVGHRNLWLGIYFRVARLEQFSQELQQH